MPLSSSSEPVPTSPSNVAVFESSLKHVVSAASAAPMPAETPAAASQQPAVSTTPRYLPAIVTIAAICISLFAPWLRIEILSTYTYTLSEELDLFQSTSSFMGYFGASSDFDETITIFKAIYYANIAACILLGIYIIGLLGNASLNGLGIFSFILMLCAVGVHNLYILPNSSSTEGVTMWTWVLIGVCIIGLCTTGNKGSQDNKSAA